MNRIPSKYLKKIEISYEDINEYERVKNRILPTREKKLMSNKEEK